MKESTAYLVHEIGSALRSSQPFISRRGFSHQSKSPNIPSRSDKL